MVKSPPQGQVSSLCRTRGAKVSFHRPSATEGLDIQRRRAKGLDDDIFMRTPCNKRMGPPVDCDFVCTGARHVRPKKSGAQGTHKLFAIRPEARFEKILMKHVPFQIASDFWSKTCPKITVHTIVRFFASKSSSFTTFRHFTM